MRDLILRDSDLRSRGLPCAFTKLCGVDVARLEFDLFRFVLFELPEIAMIPDSSSPPACVICKIDMFGVIVGVGSGSADLLGYEPNELVGSYLRKFIAGGSKDLDRNIIVHSIRTNGRHRFEVQMKRKDTSLVSVVLSNTWLSNEAKVLCLIHEKGEPPGIEIKEPQSNE